MNVLIMKSTLRFAMYMTLWLAITFGAHLMIVRQFVPELGIDILIRTYLINLIVTIIVYGLLVGLKLRFKGLLGFLFLGSGFLKFLVFFSLLLPGFKADGDVSTAEFTAFFIPYAVCLVYEVISLLRLLED